MLPSRDLLIHALRSPDVITRFSMGEWDILVRQARAGGLLARLAYRIRQHGLTVAIPAVARWHFDAAETLANKQCTAVRWELKKIHAALAGFDNPLIVLKETACVATSQPVAAEHPFSGIDILVPHERLPQVESALMLAGWHTSGLSAYDQRYYRHWVRETPPMQHIQRATVINVHHAMMPDAACHRADSARLRSRAIAVEGLPGIYVLATEDRILFSATHLFHDAELRYGLRDLSDLDLLLRDAAADGDFWPRLTARANELKLGRSLFYAIRYLRHFLDTPVPDSAMATLDAAAPNRATPALMDSIFIRALTPDHASCTDAFTPAARLAVFMRAHWLRMPAHLLIPHLFHEAFASPDRHNPKPA